jgi:RHS repeat-associated protein
VLAQEDGSGDVVWHLADHLGSVRDLVSNSGDSVNHFVYDSFGNVVSESGTIISRYLFTGREWDEEVGLQYNRARYYDTELGRFIGEDPIGFEGKDNNLYRYVDNTPITSVDPSGLVTFAVPGADGLDRLPVNLFLLPGRRYGVFPLPSNPIQAVSLAVGLVQLRQPGEPVNIIAHSNGNLNILIPLVPALRLALRGDNCEPNVRINVARLDPTFVPKATVIGANQIVDVGSNNPNSDDIRDWASLNLLRPDFRAREGVGHNDLLNEWPLLFVLAFNYGFEF